MCVPEDYYSEKMQDFIRKNCAELKHRWIYNIINGKEHETEIVLLRTRDWTLCRDGNASDGKWLVVLHDTSLQSIRDLRQKHVHILLGMRSAVVDALERHYNRPCAAVDFFVHYLPSTFQLHVHVHVPCILYKSSAGQEDTNREELFRFKYLNRRHALKHIIRNLLFRDTHYRDCILIGTLCRTSKSSAVYSSMSQKVLSSLA